MTPFKLKKVYNLTVLSQGVPPSSLHRRGERLKSAVPSFMPRPGLLCLRSTCSSWGQDTYQAVSPQLSQVLCVGGAGAHLPIIIAVQVATDGQHGAGGWSGSKATVPKGSGDCEPDWHQGRSRGLGSWGESRLGGT